LTECLKRHYFDFWFRRGVPNIRFRPNIWPILAAETTFGRTLATVTIFTSSCSKCTGRVRVAHICTCKRKALFPNQPITHAALSHLSFGDCIYVNDAERTTAAELFGDLKNNASIIAVW
jgi:hypothetical protein